MTSSLPALEIRRRLGWVDWGVPAEFGLDGWMLRHLREPMSVLVSLGGPMPVRIDPSRRSWLHASIAHRDRMPTYDELVLLHRAVWGDGWAYQVFAPPAAHVNIHAHALHLWGLPDGRAALPNFGAWGTI